MVYFYCSGCRKIGKNPTKCESCGSDNIKLLKHGAPMNVIGTKTKGKIFKIKEDEIKLLITTEAQEKVIKEYKPEQLQKIL